MQKSLMEKGVTKDLVLCCSLWLGSKTGALILLFITKDKKGTMIYALEIPPPPFFCNRVLNLFKKRIIEHSYDSWPY